MYLMWVCRICGKVSRNSIDYDFHMRWHESDPWWMREAYGYGFGK